DGIGMIVSLQAVFSELVDDPRFYDAATIAVCGALMAIWLLTVLRCPKGRDLFLFGLAPAVSVTMLPIYHRIYDAKLILLTVPACALVWKRGGPQAWCAACLTGAGFLLTGAIPWAICFRIIAHLQLPPGNFARGVLIALQSCV